MSKKRKLDLDGELVLWNFLKRVMDNQSEISRINARLDTLDKEKEQKFKNRRLLIMTVSLLVTILVFIVDILLRIL